MRVHIIGKGSVGHVVTDGVTLCGRSGVTSPAKAGTKLCAVCSRRSEAQRTESAPRTRNVSEVRAYVTARADDNARIRARMWADVSADGGTTLAVSAPTGRVTDEPISTHTATIERGTVASLGDTPSRVAPIAEGIRTWSVRLDRETGTRSVVDVWHGLKGTTAPALRVPFSHAYGDAYAWVAAHTFTSAFSASVLTAMRNYATDHGWKADLSDRDDVAQLSRVRIAETLAGYLTRPDVRRYMVCTCDTCTGVAKGRTYAPVAPVGGYVAFDVPREVRCGECESCIARPKAARWDTRKCDAPVTEVRHMALGRVVAGVRLAVAAEYMRSRTRTSAGVPMGDTREIADEVTPRVADLSSVPGDVADVLTAMVAASVIGGWDVTARNGGMTSEAATVAAILTGHVTRDESGAIVDATPMQRRMALQKIRDMMTRDPRMMVLNDDCPCAYRADGSVIRRCADHGGMPAALRRIAYAVAGAYGSTSGRGGSAHAEWNPVAGRTLAPGTETVMPFAM